jgi:hypothetical protein
MAVEVATVPTRDLVATTIPGEDSGSSGSDSDELLNTMLVVFFFSCMGGRVDQKR